MKVTGIHHMSAIVWHAQENVDFYTSVLGLKLLKRTLNFDDSNVYHLYYGNQEGAIGTATTFFPWPKNYKEGKRGDGQVGITTYAIPIGSKDFWINRLQSYQIPFNIVNRFNQSYIRFEDPHKIQIELVESDLGLENSFEYHGVTKEFSIRGIFGAILYATDFELTKDFFVNELGFRFKEESDLYIRLETDASVGRYIDIYKMRQGKSKMGAGVIHHIAFGVLASEIDKWHDLLTQKGYVLSEIKDRLFFKSLYFKEPGGINIELATTTPGFVSDTVYLEEPKLFIPPHYKHLEEKSLDTLMPLFIRPVNQLVTYPYQNKEEYIVWHDHQLLLKDINFYARLSKERTLTQKEIETRDTLRHKYIESVTGLVLDQMKRVKVKDEKGEFQSLKEKKRI